MIKKCANAYCKFGGKIDTRRDDYVEWKHFIKGEEEEDFCMHKDCWGFFLDSEISKKAKEVASIVLGQSINTMMPRLKQMMEGMNGV